MADAIRDVIIRLNLEAGNVPEIRLPVAAEVRASFEAMQTGMRSIRETAAEAAKQVGSITEALQKQLQGVSGISSITDTLEQQKRGMQDLATAAQQMRRELEQAAEARRSLDAAGSGSSAGTPLPGGAPGAGVAPQAVQQADDYAKKLETLQEAAENAAQSISQMLQEGKSLSELQPALEGLIDTIGKEAQQQFGLSADEVADLRAQLQELANKELQNVRKETEKAAREQDRMQQRMQGAWRGIGGGITGAAQAAAKFAQMVALVDSSKSESVEQLVRSFVRIQATVEGMNSVQEGLNRFTVSLGHMSTLAAGMAARQTALAGANTAAATSFTYLSRAAGMAQAAMGPIGAIISVASLALIGMTAYTQLWGEKSEAAGKKAEEGQKRYADAIQRAREQLRLQTEQLKSQNSLLEEQFRLRTFAAGGRQTAAQIAQEQAAGRLASGQLARQGILAAVEDELSKGAGPQAEARKGDAFRRVRELEEKLQAMDATPRVIAGPNSGANRDAIERDRRNTETELAAAKADLARAQQELAQRQGARDIAKGFDPRNLVGAAQAAQQLPEVMRATVMQQIREAALRESRSITDSMSKAQNQLQLLESDASGAKTKIDAARAGIRAQEDLERRLRNPQSIRDIQRDLERANATIGPRREEEFQRFFRENSQFFTQEQADSLNRGSNSNRQAILAALTDNQTFSQQERDTFASAIRDASGKTADATRALRQDLEAYLTTQQAEIDRLRKVIQDLSRRN